MVSVLTSGRPVPVAKIRKVSVCNRGWTSAHKIPGRPVEPTYETPMIDKESAEFKEALAQLQQRMEQVRSGEIEKK